MRFGDYLKKTFPFVKDKTRLIVILLLLLVLGLMYSRYLTAIVFLVLFIIIGGASKIYHRFFKSSVGIDLVFFTTIMISLVYRNLFFSLINAWLGLIIADTLAQKFSYTSVVSIIGLSITAIAAGFMPFSLIINAIILTVIFEIYSIAAYALLGSSPGRIILYFITHFAFNLFLIFAFAKDIAGIMV